jgi:alpha-L-rhamnosidase
MRYECPSGSRPRLHLQPHFPKGLDWVRASLEIPSGTVRSEWKRQGDEIAWDILVPPNTAATVIWPEGRTETMMPGKHTLIGPGNR